MKYKNHLGVGGKEVIEFRRTDVLRVIKTFQNEISYPISNYCIALLVSWRVRPVNILEETEEKCHVKGKATCTLTTDNSQSKTCWPSLFSWSSAMPQVFWPQKCQKTALLAACFAFFQCTIRIPSLTLPQPRYIIILKINALWFVGLCVCNTLKQIPFCSLVPSYLSMNFLSVKN